MQSSLFIFCASFALLFLVFIAFDSSSSSSSSSSCVVSSEVRPVSSMLSFLPRGAEAAISATKTKSKSKSKSKSKTKSKSKSKSHSRSHSVAAKVSPPAASSAAGPSSSAAAPSSSAAAPSSSAAAPSSSVPAASSSAPLFPAAYIQKWLTAHNSVRQSVTPAAKAGSMPNLVWDNTIALSAQASADRCSFSHATGISYGENIYVTSLSYNTTGSKNWQATVTNSWASEATYYDYASNTCSAPANTGGQYGCLHYTQVVWDATLRVGCGVRGDCTGDWQTIVSCQYDPAGNFNIDTTRPYST